jgi:hypothetical protein
MSIYTDCAVISATNRVEDTARFVYRLRWSPLWVEISTLAYEANFLTRNVFGDIHKTMFTATEGPTDVPVVVLGYSVAVVGQ